MHLPSTSMLFPTITNLQSGLKVIYSSRHFCIQISKKDFFQVGVSLINRGGLKPVQFVFIFVEVDEHVDWSSICMGNFKMQ